jgi:hypothetical protein
MVNYHRSIANCQWFVFLGFEALTIAHRQLTIDWVYSPGGVLPITPRPAFDRSHRRKSNPLGPILWRTPLNPFAAPAANS